MAHTGFGIVRPLYSMNEFIDYKDDMHTDNCSYKKWFTGKLHTYNFLQCLITIWKMNKLVTRKQHKEHLI